MLQDFAARMNMNVVELASRLRSQAATQLILCKFPRPAPSDGTAWVWVFGESAGGRLKQLWAGVLERAEGDTLADELGREKSLWLGGIDILHAPPSKRFRLVWTRPPAPCRIYTRRGLASETAPGSVTRHGFWSGHRQAVRAVSHVEGWISSDWMCAGITLNGQDNEQWEVIRLRNPGRFMQFIMMYDGIDLLVDTSWLNFVVPRVAEVFGVPWKIVDYTDTPPQITRQSGPPAAPPAGDKGPA